MNQTLSIAMATYNGQAYLLEQLTSIAKQTTLPTEVVICDDQSTDSTQEIVAKFSRSAPFPVNFVVNDERLGYRKNFMKAASLCTSEFIAFSDQDDIWHEAKVTEVLNYFSHSNCDLIAHDYSVFFEGSETAPIESYFDHLSKSGFTNALSIKGCTLTIRKSLVEKVGWPSEKYMNDWGHDNWICLVSVLLDSQLFIKKPLIRHRIHSTNTSGQLWGGRDRLRKLLRSIQLPPFTSKHHLDAYVAYFFNASEKEAYLDALRQCAPHLTQGQLVRARQSFSNRDAFLSFPSSQEYSHPLSRKLTALRFFLKGVYRDGDGVLGLVRDLYGDRSL